MPATAKKRPRIGPGRLSAEQAAELPDRLMDAALQLFSENGFAGATMDEIAKRAGASTKTLYSRFGNKSEILEAVVQRNVQRTVADHLRGFALRPEQSEPREFLEKFGIQVCMANLVGETSGIVRITFGEAHRYPVLGRMYRQVTAMGVNAIANALRHWREQGVIAFDADPDAAAALCFSMMTTDVRVRAALGEPPTPAEIRRHVAFAVETFLHGLLIEPKAKSKRK